MTFWSEATMAPMRNYRWKLQITGLGDDDIIWWAKTVTVPSWDMNEVEHDYFDNKYYFPGRVTWQDVEVTLVDPVSPSAVDLTNKILVNSGYNVPAKPESQKKTLAKSKAAGSTAMGSFVLELLDADGNIKETWTLNNAFIKAAKYGDLDYSNDDLRQISLTIKYDWATCKVGNEERFKKRDFSAQT
jgi:hypothetical protein